ncbi:MAG: mechanosensitive ion channel family protein [Flavobacteriales bacterium]|nr:MAG: mechanosensitive ion channel family protein [Flavobacteriales bacterium]
MDDILRGSLIISGSAVLGAAAGWTFATTLLEQARSRAAARGSRTGLAFVQAFRGLLPLWGALIPLRVVPRYLAHPMEPLLTDAVFIALVLSVCLFVSRAMIGWLRAAFGELNGQGRSASILGIIVRAIVFTIGGLVILHDLGISITPIVTALGVGGLAVALALQGTLANLFAGLQLLASRQLRVGDFVKLGSGDEGFVTDITWRNTTIRALPNHLVVVPNVKLADSILLNYDQPDPEVAVLVQVGVSYDSDLEKVESATVGAAREVMRDLQPGIKDFDPFVRFHTFGPSSIDMSVIMRAVQYTDRYELMHAFIKKLQQRYRSEGITIPFPIRTVRLENITPEAP